MNVSITSNIVNVYLNAGLIYGSSGVDSFFTAKGLGFISGLWTWYDFPALGVRGAAIATLVASVWMLFHYMYYLSFAFWFKRNSTQVFSKPGKKSLHWLDRYLFWIVLRFRGGGVDGGANTDGKYVKWKRCSVIKSERLLRVVKADNFSKYQTGTVCGAKTNQVDLHLLRLILAGQYAREHS